MDDKPFIFTSGWASPVYTDCRRLISFPRVRQTLMDFGAATVFRDAGFEQFDTVVGGETAGIPFAAWMADRLMLPMQYVRKKPKGFGRNAQIEGHLEPGQRVLLVEDLTTDGGSKINFCNALRAAGATVEHIFVIFYLRHLSQQRENPVRPQHQAASSVHLVGRAGVRQDLRPVRSGQARARSRNSCTIRPAGRRPMAASRRPPPNNEYGVTDRMEFDNSFEVPLPPEQAWPVLMNIQGIAPCMPGAQLTEVVDDKTYKGNIAVRLGPGGADLRGPREVRGDRQRQSHRARASAQGTDAKGRGSAPGRRDVPAGALRRRLQGAGAHRSHAVGRGRAIRPRRRHDPGDRLGADEPVRQQSEEAARQSSRRGRTPRLRRPSRFPPPRSPARWRGIPSRTSSAESLRMAGSADNDPVILVDADDVADRHRRQARRASARPQAPRHLGAGAQLRRRIPAAAAQPRQVSLRRIVDQRLLQPSAARRKRGRRRAPAPRAGDGLLLPDRSAVRLCTTTRRFPAA